MHQRFVAATVLSCVASSAFAQTQVTFQDGVTEVPGGIYGIVNDGTVDTEFRAANPTESQGSNGRVSVDDFDDGFQTQGAIRFDNLLISDGGLVPDGLTRDQILFAELRIWKTNATSADANLGFHRVVGVDATSGEFWSKDDTWASLGGDLIPDQGGFLDGDPIAEDDNEARSTPDFQDGFPLGDFTQPRDTTVYSSNNDGKDLLPVFLNTVPADPANPTEAEIAEAVDMSFFRYDVTDAIEAWLVDGDPNFGWAINNNTGNGWDMIASDHTGAEDGIDDGLLEQAGVLIDALTLRPALTISFSTGPRGDLDEDGDVDLDDYQALLDSLAIEVDGPIATGATGDLDFDRDVDLDDFALFKGFFADFNNMSLAQALAAPEPSAIALAVFSGLAGGATRRRERC